MTLNPKVELTVTSSSSSRNYAKRAGLQVRTYLASLPPDARRELKKLARPFARRPRAPSRVSATEFPPLDSMDDRSYGTPLGNTTSAFTR